MMKKYLVFVLSLSLIGLASNALARAWRVPHNVRIVQQNEIDPSGNIYGTIQEALDSITNASAANPYVIKVMPGEYNIGTASLQMKEYVDLEGSGRDSTVIISSNNNSNGMTCSVGTVLMADNMAIRNIKVVNSAPNLNGDYIAVAALVFDDVTAKAEGISVQAGTPGTPGGMNNGICTYGPTAHAILNNVHVETYNNGGQSNPIEFMGGAVELNDSELSGNCEGNANLQGSVDIINNNYYDPENPGSVIVNDTTLKGTCTSADCWVHGITVDGGAFETTITNSRIILNAESSMAVVTDLKLNMDNTRITATGTVAYAVNDTRTWIANSLLPGDRTGLGEARLVNNYDAGYSPIPNQ